MTPDRAQARRVDGRPAPWYRFTAIEDLAHHFGCAVTEIVLRPDGTWVKR